MKKRPVVGFQITRIETNYCNMFLPTLKDACRDRGVDLFVFAGGSLRAPFAFDYQMNTIYRYLRKENVDAAIILGASLKGYVDQGVFDAFVEGLSPLPFVSVSIGIAGMPSLVVDNRSGIRDIVFHFFRAHGRTRIAFIGGPADNPEALERLEAYREALETLGIPFDPDLVASGDFTFGSGAPALRELLDVRKRAFDGLVAANDEMALAAIRELRRRGLDVPLDVAVAGFDDINAAATSAPPLSTVYQPFDLIAKKALEIAVDLIEGRPVARDYSFESKTVLRSSCGCAYAALADFDKAKAVAEADGRLGTDPDVEDCLASFGAEAATPDRREKLERLHATLRHALSAEGMDGRFYAAVSAVYQDETVAGGRGKESKRVLAHEDAVFWEKALSALFLPRIVRGGPSGERLHALHAKARILLGEARAQSLSVLRQADLAEANLSRAILERMLVANTHERLFGVIEASLGELGVRKLLIVLEKGKAKSVVFAVRDGERLDLSGRPFAAESLFPEGFLEGEEPQALVSTPLYYRDELFGYLCLETGRLSPAVYDDFVVQVGSGLQRCRLTEEKAAIDAELNKTLALLSESNRRNEELSQTDELTRVFNRRGFLQVAQQNLAIGRRMGSESSLFFIDLDGLKGINDVYGHAEGDDAIRAAARTLQATFRATDVIARLGGDEFAVFTLENPPSSRETILGRLAAAIERTNAGLDRPWTLAMSVGAVSLAADEERPLEALLEVADALLYEEKKKKKADREGTALKKVR